MNTLTEAPARTTIDLSMPMASLGNVVPARDGPISAAVHEQACQLAVTVGRKAETLKWTVGPEARARGLDVWLSQDEFAQAFLKVGSGAAGAIAGIAGACMYGIDGLAVGLNVAAAGAAALAGCAWALTADWRINRALKKARGQRVESGQVDKLLLPFRGAAPELRAIAANAVRAELAIIDSTLSAKAAESRDVILSQHGTTPDIQRAARLSVALAKLLRKDGSGQREAIDAIIACLNEATPAERREMAKAVERCAFAAEQPRFDTHGNLDLERRLYRAVRAAENAEATAD